MDVVVLIKQVPDTATRIKVADGGREIDRQGVNYVVNPYDEFAIEEAIRIKEQKGAKVTAMTLGDAKAEEVLRTALAMGADEAVRVEAPAVDALGVARALAHAVKEIGADLVLAGKQAVDDDQAQVGTLVAALLGWPQITVVTKLDLTDDGGVAEREIEGGVEVVEFTLPAVLTAQKGLNEPRYASLPGIMKAKRKQVGKIEVGADVVGSPALEILSLTLPPARAQGNVLDGSDPGAAAAELVRLLHEEAKLI